MSIDARVELDSVRSHLVAVAGSVRPLTGLELSILLQGAADAEDALKRNWPVDTGRSQAAWAVYSEGLSLRFVNDVDYAEYVHPAGEGPTEMWPALIEQVVEDVVDPMVADLKAAITATEATGARAPLMVRRPSLGTPLTLQPRRPPVTLMGGLVP